MILDIVLSRSRRTVRMRVRVTGLNGTILECGLDSALLPTDEYERAQAFTALTNALALLAGLKQLEYSASTGDETGSPGSESERYPFAHRDGAVVHLAERRGAQTRRTTIE